MLGDTSDPAVIGTDCVAASVLQHVADVLVLVDRHHRVSFTDCNVYPEASLERRRFAELEVDVDRLLERVEYLGTGRCYPDVVNVQS